MVQPYDVGTKAWQPDPDEGWVASEVEQKVVDGDKVKLVFKLVTGQARLTATSPAEALLTSRSADQGSPHQRRRSRRRQ